MATASLARPLLPLTCFALVVAVGTGQDIMRVISGECIEYMGGIKNDNLISLPDQHTTPHKKITDITIENACAKKHAQLIAMSIKVCDLSTPPPTIQLKGNKHVLQIGVVCQSRGPCPSGLVVSVTEYCDHP